MLFREHRRRVLGMGDLVTPCGLVDEGVALNRDGTFTMGWSWHGPDLESATPEELLVVSEQLNSAFQLLDEHWLLHVDSIRESRALYPQEQTVETTPTLRLLDRTRAAHYDGQSHYRSQCYAALTYCPPPDTKDQLRKWLVTVHPDDRDQHSGWRHLETMQTKVRDVEGQLTSLLRFQRLDSAGLLTYLHATASGIHHGVSVPPMPVDLSGVIASQDFVGGRKPRLGSRDLRVVSITGFPVETTPVLLDRLNHLRVAYRWSTRWQGLSPQLAREAIRKRQRAWFRGRQGLRAMLAEVLSDREAGDRPDERLTVDPEADAMTNDAGEALTAIGRVGFGYYTASVVVLGETRREADEGAQRVANELRALQLTCRIEDNNAVEAFLGSLPGNRRHNVRRPMVSTRNLADLLPVSAPWTGPAVHPSPLYPPSSPPLSLVTAESGAAFSYAPADGDVLHTFVGGMTGAGKSTLLSWTAAQFYERYAHLNAQVFVFDKGLSAYAATRAAGGTHYEPGNPESKLAFAPLAEIADPAERNWAALWLEELLTLQGVTIGAEERRDIANALALSAIELEKQQPVTLSMYALKLSMPKLREALEQYTVTGLHGQLMDASQDGWRGGRQNRPQWHTIEMGQLDGEMLKAPIYRYLFHRIDRSLDGRPTLIIIDEAWDMLAHPLFAEKIRQWLKELRKRNAFVVLATQSISDIMTSEYSDAILESCPSKIFLPSPDALTPAGRQQYAALGLNDRQISIVGGGTKKRDYYLVTTEGRRQFRLDFSPEELAFYGVSPKDVAELREIEATHGDRWASAWLRRCGLEEAAAKLDPAQVGGSHAHAM